MINIKKIFSLLIVVGILLIFYSCTNMQTKNKGGNVNPLENSIDSLDGTLEDEISLFFLLPSPGEILEGFYNAEIQYNPEILNSANNKDKYLGSKAQSLNLGVYIADMAYLALFDRSTETINYLEAIQSLSNEAGISSTIFESLLIRSKANAGKIDSLVSISNEAFINMMEFLENGGKENTIAQISAGSYIECLYIVLQSVTKFTEDNKILTLLAELKYSMDNLLEKTNSISDRDNDNSLISFLNQISVIFNELETNSTKTIISQKQTGVISVQGGDKFIMKEADFNKLKEKVTEIRKIIVSY